MMPEKSTQPQGEALRICIARKMRAIPAKIRNDADDERQRDGRREAGSR